VIFALGFVVFEILEVCFRGWGGEEAYEFIGVLVRVGFRDLFEECVPTCLQIGVFPLSDFHVCSQEIQGIGIEFVCGVLIFWCSEW